ncbi:MAG: ATP-binding protein [Acidobacteriota bacterium]
MPLSSVRWWNRLSVQLPLVIAVGTLTIVGTAAALFLRAQEQYLIAEVVRGADLFSETIKSSTYHDMLLDRRENAYLVMDTIGHQPGIDRVRFFNKEGRVTFSTERSEAGAMVDTRAEACYRCHEAGRPLERLASGTRSRIYEARGHRVLGMVTPIYNEAGCSSAACHVHPAGKRVLGVIDIGISLSDIDQNLARIRRTTLLMAAAAVALLWAFVAFYAQRLVVRPVVALALAARQIGAGDLTHKIPVSRTGELGVLGQSFNDMVSALGKARAERLQLLETLEHQVEERTADLKQAQTQLVQSEKLSSLGRLAASIAHEINNPLAGILTYAKLLVRMLDEGDIDEQTRATCVRHLKLVQRETERCTAIVRSLLEFARQRPLSLKQIDASAVLEEASSLVGHQAKLQGITIDRRVDPLPLIQADFGQLRQAFVNIMLNACEAMKADGTLTITGRPTAPATGIELVFTDTGAGIPPDKLAKIFDPFFTTKEMGTGLGLSVVYGIIERHHGTIAIDSVMGVGTTFTIVLPTAGAQAS